MPTISGYITRSNMPGGALANLPIFNSTYMGLFGDDSQEGDSTSGAGIDAGSSSMKYTWADSPFVVGQQLVNFVKDNTTLYLRFLVGPPFSGGGSHALSQTNLATIIAACTQQFNYQVSWTLDAATYTVNCFPGEFHVGFNQWTWFGPLPPLYLSLPRDPTPVAGPL
jgi:hypothetical protein